METGSRHGFVRSTEMGVFWFAPGAMSSDFDRPPRRVPQLTSSPERFVARSQVRRIASDA